MSKFKPYRYSIDWTAIATEEEREVLYEEVADWIRRHGGYVEGGFSQEMRPQDVVPKSALALALAKESA